MRCDATNNFEERLWYDRHRSCARRYRFSLPQHPAARGAIRAASMHFPTARSLSAFRERKREKERERERESIQRFRIDSDDTMSTG